MTVTVDKVVLLIYVFQKQCLPKYLVCLQDGNTKLGIDADAAWLLDAGTTSSVSPCHLDL